MSSQSHQPLQNFHCFWLWTWSWHHYHGSRTNLLWSRNWWSLPSFARVRGSLFALGNPKHVTGNLEVEVVPLFSRGEGGTMVHSQREKCVWWLGRAPRWLLSLVLFLIRRSISMRWHPCIWKIREGVHRCSMGKILTPFSFKPRLVYTRWHILAHLLHGSRHGLDRRSRHRRWRFVYA